MRIDPRFEKRILQMPYNPGSTTPAVIANTIIGSAIGNGYLNARLSGNDIVFEILATGGTVPTNGNPVVIRLRSSPITSGVFQAVSVQNANNFTINSLSNLGCAANEKVRIHAAFVFNGAGISIAVWCASNLALTGAFCPQTTSLISTTAQGGGATLVQTVYSAAALVAEPWIYAGYCEATSGATPGQWASVDAVVNWTPGIPLPGNVVQTQTTNFSVYGTGGVTAMPGNNTIPQITDGDPWMNDTFYYQSPLNIVKTDIQAFLSPAVAAGVNCAIFRDGAVNAKRTGTTNPLLGTGLGAATLSYSHQPTAAAFPMATQFRAGTGAGGNAVSFNGAGGSALWNGTCNSYIVQTEIQG